MKLLRNSIPVVMLLAPVASMAQTQRTQISIIIDRIGATLQNIIALLFVIATLIFLWGVVRFIASAGDPGARDKSKGIMFWGIIGLAVMAAAWGIVQILIQYFGVGGTGIPCVGGGVLPCPTQRGISPGQIQ